MEKPVEISVIIPSLNSPMIDKTIDSLKKQTYDLERVEVIVVGQDKYNLIKEDNQVRFIYTPEPVNPAKARNIGIKNSSGEKIFFIDADCIADKNWIKNLIVHHNNGTSVVGGAVDFNKDNYWELCDNLAVFYSLLSDGDKRTLTNETLGSLNLSVRRNALETVGTFDENLRCSEDGDLTIRLRNSGYDIYFEPEAIVYHHPNRSSIDDLISHASLYGKSYPVFVKKYPPADGTLEKFLFSHRILIPLVAPFKIFVYLTKIFLKSKIIRRYWYSLPGVFLFFMIWHFSIFRELKGVKF